MADAKTGMEKFQEGRPLEREFKIVCAATSTDEVGVEIDTDIAAGSKFAWAIVGLEWAIEVIAAPNLAMALGRPAADGLAVLQLIRGELPVTPVHIGRHDNRLIGEDMVEVSFSTSVGFEIRTWPRQVPFMDVTQLPTIHAIFGTTSDFSTMSAATNRIVGKILYHLVSAPKARHEDL